MVLAIWLPVYTVDSNHAGMQPQHSLVRVFGYRVLLLAAIPFIISVVVALLLQLRVATQRRWPPIVASTLAWALLVAAIVGTVTILIGIFVLPVGVLLSLATRSAGNRVP
jgi:fatty acid desaturase